jgi:hypothetical protein
MIPAMGASRSLGLAHGVNLPQVLMSVSGTGALLNLEKGGGESALWIIWHLRRKGVKWVAAPFDGP